MKTRQDYMDKKCTHEEYYAQFVTPEIKRRVLIRFTKDELVTALSEDRNLNNIPLNIWDAMTGYPHAMLYVRRLKEAGDTCSLCSGVCILKEAARQIAEEQ